MLYCMCIYAMLLEKYIANYCFAVFMELNFNDSLAWFRHRQSCER